MGTMWEREVERQGGLRGCGLVRLRSACCTTRVHFCESLSLLTSRERGEKAERWVACSSCAHIVVCWRGDLRMGAGSQRLLLPRKVQTLPCIDLLSSRLRDLRCCDLSSDLLDGLDGLDLASDHHELEALALVHSPVRIVLDRRGNKVLAELLKEESVGLQKKSVKQDWVSP